MAVKIPFDSFKRVFTFREVLRVPIAVILGIAIGLLLSVIVTLRDITWSDIALNLFAEALGIVGAVFLIDKAIHNDDANKRKRMMSAAVVRLRNTLTRHVTSFLTIAQFATPESKNYMQLGNMTDETLELIGNVDVLDKPYSGIRDNERRWGEIIVDEFSRFKESIAQFIEAYATVMEYDDIEILERILASSMMRNWTETFPSLLTVAQEHGETYFGGKECLIQYFQLLYGAQIIYNKYRKPNQYISLFDPLFPLNTL